MSTKSKQPTTTTRARLLRSQSTDNIPLKTSSTTRSQKTTPTSKRKIDSTSPNKITSIAKKKSTMATITYDDFQKLLTQQTQQLQATISSTVQTEVQALGNELKQSFQTEISRIDKRIDEVQQHYVSEIAQLRSDVSQCIDKIDNSDDYFARTAKMNSLKLTGLAHATNENLQETFTKIANLIGFDTTSVTNIPELSRLSKRNRSTNELLPIPTVIMKFVAKHIRDKFYGLYISRLPGKPIKTDDIGLPQGGKITIGEDLTPLNQTIFNAAIKYKSEGKLVRVFTNDGLVQVRAKQTDRSTKIRSLRELEIFVANATVNNTSSSLNQPPNQSQQQNTASHHQNTGTGTENTNSQSQQPANGDSSNTHTTINNNNNTNNSDSSTTNNIESQMEH